MLVFEYRFTSHMGKNPFQLYFKISTCSWDIICSYFLHATYSGYRSGLAYITGVLKTLLLILSLGYFAQAQSERGLQLCVLRARFFPWSIQPTFIKGIEEAKQQKRKKGEWEGMCVSVSCHAIDFVFISSVHFLAVMPARYANIAADLAWNYQLLATNFIYVVGACRDICTLILCSA